MSQKEPETFESFMRRALYDRAHGYYSGNIRSIGRRGDFTTAPMLSSLPARAIAAWALRAMRETRCRNLIEIGPGEGQLAAAVIAALPWHVRCMTHLHLVETSTTLAAIQRQTLGKLATWHQSPAAALKACDGKAVIFSNELVDAFPVRRFEKSPDGWREIAVSFDADGRARESLMPPATLPDSSGFSTTHPDGQRIEVHESYHDWLRDWLPLWKTGRMLTIDYGSTADRLYHRRPRGTIRGYLMHQRVEGAEIYRNIGRQDLTADVNFSDLINWGAPWLDDTRLVALGDFLTIPGRLKYPGDLHLADSTGPGGAFLVLDQRRASLCHRTPCIGRP